MNATGLTLLGVLFLLCVLGVGYTLVAIFSILEDLFK